MLSLTALCALAALMPLAMPASTKSLVGLSLNIKQDGTTQDLVHDILAEKEMGVKVLFISHKWSELEPAPGKLAPDKLGRDMAGSSALGFQIALTLQTLDTNNRTLPSDLMDRRFDDPEMRRRFAALLTALAPRLTSRVRWVMLGNEVDVYLAAHPQEAEAFAGMMEDGEALLRRLRPDVSVGVTTTFDGLATTPGVVKRLLAHADVATMTYYPLNGDFTVRPVSDVARDFTAMVAAAGTKPLLIQEAGYPMASLLGSSEEKQAEFVDAVFAAMTRHKDRIACVNFFLLYDFSPQMTDSFLKYYRLADPKFRAYLATLGFKRADGAPRLAWTHFVEDMKRWNTAD